MHILIGTDGSEVSIEAARRAVQLLRPGHVTIATAADTRDVEDTGAGGFAGPLMDPEEAEHIREDIVAAAEEEAHETATSLGLPNAAVNFRIVEGGPGPLLCSLAAELDVDVVVVGSSGKGLWSRVLLGSVSEYVVRHSPVPVLVLRHDEDERG